MTVFTCKDDYTSMMTCIYVAWASKLGHSNVKLGLEPIMEPDLFSEYIHVDPDDEKADSVTKSIQAKISLEAYRWVYYASCSCDPSKLDTMYRFLVKGFHFGQGITCMLQDTDVQRMMEHRRKVSNEAHLFREFTRFASINNKVYMAHIAPKSDVLMTVASYFNDRMPSEHWIIIDDNRSYAAVHPVNQDFYLRSLTERELTKLSETDVTSDYFVSLWKTYFESIAIKERTNYICQRSHFPLWMRKNVTEFN